jgi:prepilin-type N-terminal cleavage/methylation domain-containing protein
MSKKASSAMTLTELLVVMAIIVILASLIGGALGKARAYARRVQCLQNLRTLGQAAFLYAENNFGKFPYFKDPGNDATVETELCFGSFYDPKDFDDLSLYQCPSQRDFGNIVNPVSTPYVITPADSISYRFVFNGTNPITPQTTSFPMSNILLIEKFNEDPAKNCWDDTCNHGTDGGSVFYLSGKAKFLEARTPNSIPQNKRMDLSTYPIETQYLR